MTKKMDYFWDDNPVDVSQEANFIWSIANKLRGVYMPDKYGDVIIPMTIIRRFECTLEPTKGDVLKEIEKNPDSTEQVLCKKSKFQFYNTSKYNLAELCSDPDHLVSNFKSYINGFSANIQDILKELKMSSHIETMEEGGCLYSVVEAFSSLDVYPSTFDSIKMGYIFEDLIGRFYQNVDAGQFYTGRDIIKCLVSILISEGSDDIFDDHKVVTVCDQACGTGGMLSTAYSYLKHYNPTCDVRLFGQEFMGQSYAVGLAEMLIKGQDARNFRHADTFKTDCFQNTKVRYMIENPPFGTAWAGEDAKEGQEEAVRNEYTTKGLKGRFPAGLPSGTDGQLLFMQSAIAKMDDDCGRAAIIENGSPLFAGGTASGESQIRRWMLENDLIEAIIAFPTDLFYNTGIQTYAWILSKNKRSERKGKIQLIDASNFYTKLRKSLGKKRKELSPENRKIITELYVNFEENEYSKIFDNEEFLYREYAVMQPLQRSYAINKERIENMISKGSLNSLYDEGKVYELENPTFKEEKEEKNKKKTKEQIEKQKQKELERIKKNKKQLQKFYDNKPLYDQIMLLLNNNISENTYLSKKEFEPVINKILLGIDKKIISKVVDGLSQMDKTAEIHRDKNNNIVYDKETKDIEIVKYKENIKDYMAREVLPHIPDAKAFFEADDENASFIEDKERKTVKIGAEIPFTRYFYKYQQHESSDELLKEFLELDKTTNEYILKLVK